MAVLVTGGIGYIGSHTTIELIEALLKATETQEKIAKEVIQMKQEPKAEEEKKNEPEQEIPEETEEYEETDETEAEENEETEADVEADNEYDDEEEMDPDEFAQYACQYAADIDCSIVDKSMLALYERIEMMEEDGVRLTRKAAVDLIESAADKAEKQSFGRKLLSLVSPMYDKDGYLILREKDFFD